MLTGTQKGQYWIKEKGRNVNRHVEGTGLDKRERKKC